MNAEPDPESTLPSAPIAVGNTSEVFAWGDGRVLKLYRRGRSVDGARREHQIGARLQEMGLPAPRVFGVEEIDGRAGVVFECIEGIDLQSRIRRRPWALRHAAMLQAELHAGIHEKPADGLPSHREVLSRALEEADDLTGEERRRLLEQLSRLPEGDRLCHGDFHPENVLLTKRGPIVIDWPDAGRGDPLADVARSWVLRNFVRRGDSTRAGFAWKVALRRAFVRLYVKRYAQLTGTRHRDIERWITLAAAGRLAEGVPEHDQLLRFVRSRMKEGAA